MDIMTRINWEVVIKSVTIFRRYEKIDLLGSLKRPKLLNGVPQLLIGLVHLIRILSHLDSQALSNERKQRGGEVHLSLLVDGHVHSDEPSIGEYLGTLGAEAHRRLHVQQHLVHVFVVHFAAPRWVDVRPCPDVLVQVVSAQYWRVSSQVVEVVHNYGHEQVQHLVVV